MYGEFVASSAKVAYHRRLLVAPYRRHNLLRKDTLLLWWITMCCGRGKLTSPSLEWSWRLVRLASELLWYLTSHTHWSLTLPIKLTSAFNIESDTKHEIKSWKMETLNYFVIPIIQIFNHIMWYLIQYKTWWYVLERPSYATLRSLVVSICNNRS